MTTKVYPEWFRSSNEAVHDDVYCLEHRIPKAWQTSSVDAVIEALTTCAVMNDVQNGRERPVWGFGLHPLVHTHEGTILRVTQAVNAHAMKVWMRMNNGHEIDRIVSWQCHSDSLHST